MRRCKHCGCTDANACLGGCCWITDDACSSCVVRQVEAMTAYSIMEHHALETAIRTLSPEEAGAAMAAFYQEHGLR